MDEEQNLTNDEDMPKRRREARRRKLLLKSEERMKKIMGYSKEETEDDYKSEPVTQTDDDTSDKTECASPLVNSLSSSHHHHHDDEYKRVDAMADSKAEDTPAVASLHTDVHEMNRYQQADAAAKKSFSLYRTLIVLMMGVLVRSSLMFAFGDKYVQTLVNPFLALQIALFGYQKAVGLDYSKEVKGGLWMTVLLLGGFKQEMIDTYQRMSSLLAGICEDFALYLFTFVMTHICISAVLVH